MKVPWKCLGFCCVVALVGPEAAAGDVGSDMKKAGKSIGKAAKEFGESVADATEEGAKTAWFATRNWATRESKHVADATVRFWDDMIDDKESKRDRLRRENKELKKKAREKGR